MHLILLLLMGLSSLTAQANPFSQTLQLIKDVRFESNVENPTQKNEFEKREKKWRALYREGKTLDGLRALFDLALLYTQDHRIQEAAWTLRIAGENELADLLETKLETYLETAPIIDAKLVGTGLGNPIEITFPGQIAAIAKNIEDYEDLLAIKTFEQSVPAPPHPPSEVLAYVFDRIHELNVVPVTIQKKMRDPVPIRGETFLKTWSLQYKVRDLRKKFTDLRFLEYGPKHWKLFFLDYSVHQKDRYDIRVRPGGEDVGYDNSAMFHADHQKYFFNFDSYNGKRNNKLQLRALPAEVPDLLRLVKPTVFEIRQKLKPYAPEQVIGYYLFRRHVLLNEAFNQALRKEPSSHKLKEAFKALKAQAPQCLYDLSVISASWPQD